MHLKTKKKIMLRKIYKKLFHIPINKVSFEAPLVKKDHFVPIDKNVSGHKAQNYRIIKIKDHYDFDRRVVNSDNPIIVDFHVDWCEACLKLSPKIKSLLETNPGMSLAVVDIDLVPKDSLSLIDTYEIKVVPSVLAFNEGVVVDKFEGYEEGKIEKLVHTLMHKVRPAPNAVTSQSCRICDSSPAPSAQCREAVAPLENDSVRPILKIVEVSKV